MRRSVSVPPEHDEKLPLYLCLYSAGPVVRCNLRLDLSPSFLPSLEGACSAVGHL